MNSHVSSAKRRFTIVLPVLASLGLLASCGGSNDMTPAPSPTPTPVPTPTATAANFNVTPCLEQGIPGTGFTVAQAVVPDTLTLNLAAASGFPNGRRLPDPVIDVTLAVIFLKLSTNGPGTLAGLPLNPPANDVAYRSSFPYLAPAQGSPPLADNSGTTFTFRTDPASSYVRVDRMGMPAVSTALIGSSRKNAYNDASPADDAAGTFVPDLGANLTALTNALADDLVAAGLTPCATPA
ncbi:MAG: DUF4331 family protein [Pseudomonadota bacterium]